MCAKQSTAWRDIETHGECMLKSLLKRCMERHRECTKESIERHKECTKESTKELLSQAVA